MQGWRECRGRWRVNPHYEAAVRLLDYEPMPQLRKDPFGPTWVIISPERGLEPSDFGSADHTGDHCRLCPGMERAAGKEVRAIRPSTTKVNGPGWQARVVANETVYFEAKPFEPGGPPLFRHAPSSGISELVVEHPVHGLHIEDMPRDHLIELIKLYRDRIEHLSRRPDIQHVQLTRNVGQAAGAVFEHAHAQILAMPVSNRWLDEERQAAGEYFNREGRCLFCDVIEAELGERLRLVSYNELFVAVAPYASKTPFEAWILPRQHASSFASLSSNAIPHLVDLLKAVLAAMNGALSQPPYNMTLHTLPQGKAAEFHWNLKILPRLTAQAGFDWASGFYVNPTPPEDAARFLREALTLQGVTVGT